MKPTILIASGALTALVLSPVANADTSAETLYLSQVQALGLNGSPTKIVRTGHEVCDQASLGAPQSVMADALLTGSRNVNGADAIIPNQAAGMVAFAIDTLCPGALSVPAQAPQPVPRPQPAVQDVPQAAPESPTPASSSKADAAVDRAMTLVNTDTFGPTGCVKLVGFAYNIGATGAGSALELRNRVGEIHKEGTPPKGALVFSQSDHDIIDGQHYGHVVLAKGDGTYISGGVSGWGNGKNVQILPSWNIGENEYLGWAMPPW